MKSMQNGQYMKAKICGVSSREVVSKKNGEIFTFFNLIVEESLVSHKKFIQLAKKHVDKGMVSKLEELVGKTCLFSFYSTAYGDRINYHYSGDDLPILIV